MKKTLVTLAVLGAFAGVASADVTVYGIIDTNIQRTSADGSGSVLGVNTGGMQTSRYGLKGSEDLGNGLKANFVLEGQFNSDTGAIGPNTSTDNRTAGGSSTALFGRRSIVGLSGGFGAVDFGRDYVPSYQVLSGFSAFGINGSAATQAQECTGLGLATSACPTRVRASNAILYTLPGNLGGFYGKALYAFGENNSNATDDSDGRVIDVRVGFKAAGLDVTVANHKTKYTTPAVSSSTPGDFKRTVLGASYTIGNFKPMLFWNDVEVKTSASAKAERKDWGLGLVATFGQHQVRATYHDYDVKNTDNDANLIGLGYAYNMSKRTTLYATYGRVDNDNTGTAFKTVGGTTPTTAGGASTGYEVGVMHSF